MRRFTVTCALCAVLTSTVSFMAGCGGGGSPTAKTVATTGRAVISVQWPERSDSRLIPLAANSLRVSFLAGATVVRTALLSRGSGETTETQTEVDLPAGTLTVRSEAFPSADGSGNVQASATVPVTIQAGQRTPVSLTMASTINRVAITPDVIPFSTDPVPVTAVAYDLQNRVIVTGSWQWSVPDDGIIDLVPSGATATVQARKEGTTTITLRETESGKTKQKQLVVLPQS